MSWDSGGRMLSSNIGGQYVTHYRYDASNRRVLGPQGTIVRGIDGKVIGSAYFGGKKVGQKEDRLGTVQNGSRFYPYGEESPATGQNADKFATYWRDANTNFDYAMNRYYMPAHGRFLSPDPLNASGTEERSGSWNRFSYVEGNPLNYYDPSGLMMFYAGNWWDERTGANITAGPAAPGEEREPEPSQEQDLRAEESSLFATLTGTPADSAEYAGLKARIAELQEAQRGAQQASPTSGGPSPAVSNTLETTLATRRLFSPTTCLIGGAISIGVGVAGIATGQVWVSRVAFGAAIILYFGCTATAPLSYNDPVGVTPPGTQRIYVF